ncbi:MAG TPA: hypothetical protein IAB64_03625 [Candidatus Coproplasma excrementavium]|mgnify:FL=1|nr:hypothetical protein [Candidatus Coproplasma excrementavium]
MNTQKRNRLIAAGTVTIVLLLVVLVAIMIYQLVVIVNLNNRKKELQEEYTRLEYEIDNYDDILDYYKDLDKIKDLAIEMGIIGG